MKIRNTLLKYLTLASSLFTIVAPTTISLTNCSNTNKFFSMATSNDVFANSVVQLGASFVDSPSTTEFRSIYGGMVTYVNEGDYEYNSEGELISEPKARLVLEAATKIVIYGNSNNGAKAEQTLLTIDSAQMETDTSGAFINDNGVYSINLEKVGEAMVKATRIEFTLNKELSWVDKNGVSRQPLVPKDFLYSLIGYKQSSEYSLNANGYYMSLAGIDYEKTIKYQGNDSITPGGTFTYCINETKVPYFLDVLTKQYFFPIPHTRDDAKATIETPETKNVLAFTKSSQGKDIIDKLKTDWTKVYGGAQEKEVDVWSIGPYYISHSSQIDVSFSINQNYFDAMKPMVKMNQLDIEKKIPLIIKKYKAGDARSIYNKYNSGEISYAPVPQEQNDAAVSKYWSSDELIPIPAPKSTQGRYIGYNLGIYSADGEIKDKNLISTTYEKFVKKFHSENTKKIRKGINEYINWAKLAQIRYGVGVKDFSLSTIPYGVYPIKTKDSGLIDYYRAIGESKTLDNGSSNEFKPTGIIGGKYSNMLNSELDIIASNTEIEEFRKLLTTEGYTKSTPLKLPYWTLSQANNASDNNYFQDVGRVMSNLSDGAIEFTYKSYDASQTVTNVYHEKKVPMGDMLWGPDYNGLGTWVGIYFTYEYDSNGNPIDLQNKIKDPDASYQDTLMQSYHITNLWKPLYEEMNKINDTNSLVKTNSDQNKWLSDLKSHLTTTKAAEFGEGKTYKNIKSNLDTQISIWAGVNQYNGANLIEWMDNQAPILPMYQPGLKYIAYKLVNPKYTIILNVNGDVNYRDFVLNY